jgi:hypothetical protein
MRRFAALLAFAALAGCTSGGTNPIIEEAWDELQGFRTDEAAATPPGAPPPRALTRADIETADVAAIWGRLASDSSPTLMYATAQNGPYVTYFSPFRQSITLRGSQVTATRGLGWDLLSAWSSPADPVTRPTRPADWPAGVERTYEFPADGPRGRIETYACRIERGPARELVILQRRHVGVEFSETCTGPAGTFENLYFADAATGFVWRSLQWTGPRMELLDIQVLEPLD